MRLRYTAGAPEHIAAIFSYVHDRSPATTQAAARIRLAAEPKIENKNENHRRTRSPDTALWRI